MCVPICDRLSIIYRFLLFFVQFEGAKLKTVSGIRGQIKKAVRDGDPGSFRASFEDKILLSDIVTCRLWVPVDTPQFYNPVLSLLTGDPGSEGSTSLMRTVGQIRRENQVPIELNKDSLYKKIVRIPREFKKLAIPKKLQDELPFKSKPKAMDTKRAGTYVARRAVIAEPEDRRKRAAVQILSAIGADKLSKRHQAQVRRSAARSAEQERTMHKFEDISREARKRAYRDIGKEKSAKKGRHT